MATNFPNSPSDGDTHAGFTYNATKGAWLSAASSDGAGEGPIVYTEPPTSHTLNTDGSTSTVQMQAVDPEGTAITYGIAYANSTNARPTQLVADTTIDQSTGTYTFDPSATLSHAGSFKARLSASDGITHATRFVDFSLQFPTLAHYLVVAGGGGGGYWSGGGGGAGGLRTSFGSASGGGGSAESQLSLNSGTTYTITVGAGGAGASSGGVTGSTGVDSSVAGTGITTITSVGGGGGGGGGGAGGGGGCGS